MNDFIDLLILLGFALFWIVATGVIAISIWSLIR